MSAAELAAKIEGLIVSGSDRFADQIAGIQNKLYNDLVLILKGIETDVNGNILQSGANRKVLNQAVTKINETFADGSKYVSSIEKQIELIPSINELNNIYFESISSGFTANKNFIKSLERQTISSLENQLLNEGLQSQVKQPLVDILNRNVNSGGSFNGFLEEVRDYVKGNPDREGKLLRYSKQILRDTLAIYARSYQHAITKDLGLVWFQYVGGVMDKTRPFCEERAGNFYHESEIKSWAKLDWKGKMPGTTESSIFEFAGGFQCGHQIIAVHQSIVPKMALDRIAE